MIKRFNKTIAIVFVVLAIFVFSCQNSELYRDHQKEIRIGEKYTIPLELNVGERPDIIGAECPVFTTELKIEYEVNKIDGGFAQIRYGSQIGWIPLWYLTEEASKVIRIEPILMNVSNPAKIYIYPNAQTPLYSDFLEQGKVVKVKAEYNNWCLIDYITYDCPYFDPAWIKKEHLTDYLPESSIEGYVKEGTVFINKEEEVSKIVIIKRELDDLYFIYGAGGQSGYIKQSDFIPYDITSFPK